MSPSEPAPAEAPRKRSGIWLDLSITAGLTTVLMLVVLRYLPLYDKSLFWYPDGPAQHYPALYFLNDWLRGMAYNPSAGVPLWSWRIGLGADVISTMSWHVLGDPFNLISLLFPMRYLESAFALAYALRIVAAAIVSTLYFRRMGAATLPSAVGSVIYVFATYLTYGALHHPMFFNGMVMVPLLLIGVENVLERKRSWTLTLFVAASAITNYYFFYIATIITVVYAVARYFQRAEKASRWRGFVREGLRFAGYYVAGIAIAAPTLLPTAWAIANTSRGQADYQLQPFYELWSYRSIVASLSSSVVGARSTFLGYGYLGLVLVPAFFVARKANGALKFMVVAFAFFVTLPVFGSIFNGFTFPYNRFSFAWGLFIAAIAALLLTQDRPFSRKEIAAMSWGYVVYVTFVLFFCQPLSQAVLAPMAFGALTIAVFALEGRDEGAGSWEQRRRGPGWLPARWQTTASRWAVIGLLVANVIVNGVFMLDIRYNDTLTEYVDAGEVRGLYNTSRTGLIGELPRDEVYRVENTNTTDNAKTWLYYNTALVKKYMSTSFYFSIMNGFLTEYKAEIDNPAGWSSFSYDGFDDRAMPMTLAGAKYYITRQDQTAFVPFGFERDTTRGKAVAFRNANALPLGFVYTQAIDRSDYEPLVPVDKQSAQLQGVVIDDGVLPDLPRIKPVRDAVELDYALEGTSGATFDQAAKTIVRTEPDSRIDLSVERVPDSEIYVELTGIENTIQSPGERPDKEIGANPSTTDQAQLGDRDRIFRQPPTIATTFSTDRASKKSTFRTQSSQYYWGRTSQLVNLGYHRDGASRVSIEPSLMGTLSFDTLKVWALPMAEYPKRVAKLAANPLTDIELGTNRVTGKVDSPSDGVLFLEHPVHAGLDGDRRR